MDRNLKEAWDALMKIEESEIAGIGDWYAWWFGNVSTNPKKLLGIVLITLAGILIGQAAITSMGGSSVLNSTFGLLGIIIVFLILPFIRRLKVGAVEVDVDYVQKRVIE